jgi:hypothetical protein
MPRINKPLPINLQLFDKAPDKFAIATVRLPTGIELAGSPFLLQHTSGGFYAATEPVLMPQAEFVSVFYEVYEDAAFTVKSFQHSEAFETHYLEQTVASGQGSESDLFAVIDNDEGDVVAILEDVRRGA